MIRVQMEKVRPPRGLWVPFELGRPLGEPGDPAFQRRVLMRALRLLERSDGPVILEDFAEDAPGWRDRPGWRPPFELLSPPPAAALTSGGAWAAAMASEIAVLRPFWDRTRTRFGRSTVGLFGQPPDAWPGVAARFLDGELPASAGHATPALALRFLADDLKAYYGEAAQAVGDPPASRQIDGWFWRETLAGRFLIALRGAAEASGNNALKTVGTRFFVPAPYLPS